MKFHDQIQLTKSTYQYTAEQFIFYVYTELAYNTQKPLLPILFYPPKYSGVDSQLYFHSILAPSLIHDHCIRYLSYFSKPAFTDSIYSILKPSKKSYLNFQEQNSSVAVLTTLQIKRLLLVISLSLS